MPPLTINLALSINRAGYKSTAPRQAVLRVVTGMRSPLTAHQILIRARRGYPPLGLVTVYRTLESLRDAGLVEGMDDGGPARFSLRDLDHPHHHLVCSQCGAVAELAPEPVLGFASQVRRRTGFRLQTDHLTLPGRCRKCAGRGKED